MAANSKRQFQLVWLEGDSVTNITISLNDMTYNTDDYEYIYSLQDNIDNILDMKVDEVIHHQFNRDDSTRKGVIRRHK